MDKPQTTKMLVLIAVGSLSGCKLDCEYKHDPDVYIKYWKQCEDGDTHITDTFCKSSAEESSRIGECK